MAVACLAMVPFASQATSITIGDVLTRTATLDSATAGVAGDGNATASVIDGEFATQAPWTIRGDVAAADGTDGLLTVALTSGAWGGGDAAGTWAIAPSFWTLYGNAVIAIHVGHGNTVAPDHFSFLIEQGETTGTWSYDMVSGNGGGLSNLHLFSSGDPIPPDQVPDGGSTLALLGLAAVGAGLARMLIKN